MLFSQTGAYSFSKTPVFSQFGRNFYQYDSPLHPQGINTP